MPELVSHADSAIANEEDIQMTLGIQADVDVRSGHLDRVQYEGLTAKVLAQTRTRKRLGLLCGESHSTSHNGWSACLNDRRQFLVSRHYDIAHIVDRAGSGDCFAAGLIHGLQKLPTAREPLEFAVAASCLKHSIPGDFNRSTVEEVDALLKGGGRPGTTLA